MSETGIDSTEAPSFQVKREFQQFTRSLTTDDENNLLLAQAFKARLLDAYSQGPRDLRNTISSALNDHRTLWPDDIYFFIVWGYYGVRGDPSRAKLAEVNYHLARARKLKEQKVYGDAHRHCDQAIETAKETERLDMLESVYRVRGNIFYSENKYDEAAVAYSEAKNPIAAARSFVAGGRYDEATAICETELLSSSNEAVQSAGYDILAVVGFYRNYSKEDHVVPHLLKAGRADYAESYFRIFKTRPNVYLRFFSSRYLVMIYRRRGENHKVVECFLGLRDGIKKGDARGLERFEVQYLEDMDSPDNLDALALLSYITYADAQTVKALRARGRMGEKPDGAALFMEAIVRVEIGEEERAYELRQEASQVAPEMVKLLRKVDPFCN